MVNSQRAVLAAIGIVVGAVTLVAQDRLKLMPGYEQFTSMQSETQNAFISGAVQNVRWDEDGQAFTYTWRNRPYRFDLATRTTAEQPNGAGANRPPGAGRGQPPPGMAPPTARGGLEQAQHEMPAAPMNGCPVGRAPRGRQTECSVSPDGHRKAFYRARNFWIANADGTGERQVTTDGSETARIKEGSGSWVYGEELGQTTAMWWSPDSRQVAYYRFDEGQVHDFYLGMNQTGLQSVMDVEAYPKAGAPNPIAEVFVYDIAAGRAKQIDVRDGKPFDDGVVGHYVYDIRWSPDGSELLMNRTNRRQQVMEFVACSPATTKCRVVVREEWPTGWTDNEPSLTWLKDQKRFIWESERNGWRNYYLYDLTGKLLNPITTHSSYEAGAIVKVDEAAGVLYYMARSGDNFMKSQLHRVGLDGRGDTRLTDPRFTHTATLSPDGRYAVDTFQTHDVAPRTQLLDISSGTEAPPAVVATIAESDTSKVDTLHVRRVEQFNYLAADGKTPLVGQIAFPTNFDPARKWPTLVSVYGGPASGGNVPTENFTLPNAYTEYGFLVVSLSSRAAPGMGKRTLDAIYLKLGVTEVDDMAAGLRSLWDRPYFDKDRVGIYGTSYGGYVSALMILRHPDVVAAASASSAPTSWRHYDSIYTERYMWIPQENEEGYEAGSAMKFAKDLRGRLLIYYGTADNNVHPNNSMQLIRALQQAGKSFEVQVGPDVGHSGVNAQRMMEFFIENLVLRPERAFGR